MIIPLSTDLRLGRQPWVTWVVMTLCLIIFGFEFESNLKYDLAVHGYCQLIAGNKHKQADDLLSQNINGCSYLLHSYHIQTLRGEDPEKIETGILESFTDIPKKESTLLLASLRKHHSVFAQYAPSILDEKIMYFPRSFNPLTMITSSLAHGGFWHLFGNLIFFFAFAPAIELLIGSGTRYSLSLVSIAIGCSVFYSLFALAQGSNVPGLGLSGVVMGVIGLSAYMMPHARINTLIWFIVPLMRISIPAWFMALWFIGFDAWELLSQGMNNGVNLVAHVSGGVVGYLIGRFFFKKRKEEVQDDLNEEIAFMQAQRGSPTMSSTYKNMQALERVQNEELAKKQRGAHLDLLFNMVRTEQSSEAINLVLADADPIHLHPSHFEELFKQVGDWKKHRTYLCLGRLLIDLYMQHRRYADAFKIVKQCLEVSREFVLANPRDVLMLAQEANRQRLYKIAVALLHRVEERYPPEVGYIHCGLLEVDILSNQLNMAALATKRLQALKAFASPSELENITALQAELAPAG